MNLKEMEQAMTRLANHRGHRLAALLVRWKNLTFVPAASLLPYLRLGGFTVLYLYCLARQKDASM